MLRSQWSKAQIEALTAAGNGQRLAPVLVILDPGGSSGKKAYASLGEEFAMVQEGIVELTLEGREQTLEAGDAVMISPGALRRWHNPGEQPARILIVGLR